jgi:hypothetical protein
VIGVKGHEDGVAPGHPVHVLGDGDRPQSHVLHRGAGGKGPLPVET